MLEWDSAHFGLRIARIASGTLDPGQIGGLARACSRSGLDCVYLLADPSDAVTHLAACGAGFRLVDIRLVFRSDAPEGHVPEFAGEGITVAEADADASGELLAMAGGAFTDSRFYRDGRFPCEDCDRLYGTWLRKSLSGEMADAVLVARIAGVPSGFVTCSITDAGGEDARGEIGLLAVSQSARGRGVGRRLVAAALDWFADGGAGGACVATQLRNVGAVRLYESSGFRLDSAGIWYHLWHDERLGDASGR